jgi:riboflavin transporter FmnP
MKTINKVILCSILTSLSIVIDILLNTVLHSNLIGLPYHALPLILSGVILGPFYGFVSALISDTFGTIISGQSYLPLYGVATILWGIIPYFFYKKKKSDYIFLGIGILVTHLLVTLINTISNFIYFGVNASLVTLYPRLIILPFNVILLTYLAFIIINRIFKSKYYYNEVDYEN